jgi:hypothetical protein
MIDNKKKMNIINPGRILSVCLMIFCLSFLTALNYFRYSSDEHICSALVCDDTSEENSDIPPGGPTEEKSSSSGSSFAEEMLHESHPTVNFNATNFFYLHHIAEAEKLEIFHPEILLPPPKPMA